MTAQTKAFIEISDIVGLQFECRHCHSTITLKCSGKEVRVTGLRSCPNCLEPWAQLSDGGTIELNIKTFIDQVKEFQELLRRRDEFTPGRGFSLLLEVKSDAVPLLGMKAQGETQ